MSAYQTILACIELNHSHDNVVIQRALSLAGHHTHGIHLVHTIQPVAPLTTESAFFELSDIENQITEEHKNAIFTLALEHNIAEQQVFIITGSPSKIIPELAKKMNADLILVGNHDKSGLELLISSTAKSLLKNPCCDVLAVKVPA
jgi:nucleotide-binding universal stress UspA family protein